MGDILDELTSKQETDRSAEFDNNVKSKKKIQFQNDYEPISSSITNLDQFNVGRRRSKSHGYLNGNQNNLPDFEYQFNFEGDTVEPRRNISLDYELQNLTISQDSAGIRRKVASSFHVFEDENEDLFSRPLSPELGGKGSGLGFDFEPVVGSSNSLLDQLRAKVSRDRAESDMGLYPSLRSRLQSETMDERSASKLRQPTTSSKSGLTSLSPTNNGNANNGSNNNAHHQHENTGYQDDRSGYTGTPTNKHNYSGNNHRPPAGAGKNDWICMACGNENYAWRHVCNMRKCRAPKPGHLQEAPPSGSWACPACGNLNYPERMVCNMRKCRSPRPLDPTLIPQIQQQQQAFMQYNQHIPAGFNQYDPTRQNMMGMQIGLSPHAQPHAAYYGGLSPKMQYVNSVNNNNSSVQDLSQQMMQNRKFQESNYKYQQSD